MYKIIILTILVNIIACETIRSNGNYYVPLSCGTSTTNGCEYSISVVSEELLDVYLMPFSKFVSYVKHDYSGDIAYYSFFLEQKVKEFSQRGNSGDEIVVLLVHCLPQNVCDGAHFNGCTNPPCNVEVTTFEEELSQATNLNDELFTGSGSFISASIMLYSFLSLLLV